MLPKLYMILNKGCKKQLLFDAALISLWRMYNGYTESNEPSCPSKKRVKTGLLSPSEKKKGVSKIATIVSETTIQDSILTGDLIKALEDAEMSPLHDTRYIRDSIFHIINDDEIMLALTNACTKKKKKPEVLFTKVKSFCMEKSSKTYGNKLRIAERKI